jgi:molybdopterin-binding protein
LRYGALVVVHRLKDAAELLGVSDDTVRRWVATGRLEAGVDDKGRQVVDGAALAAFARERAAAHTEIGGSSRESARNQFTGLVTNVIRDTVMAQVELQCGPFRVVSLVSREAADELGLEPGVTAIASIKSTNVVIELPKDAGH